MASTAQSRAEQKKGTLPVPPPGTQSVSACPPFSASQRRVQCVWGPRGRGSGRRTSTCSERAQQPGPMPHEPGEAQAPCGWSWSGLDGAACGKAPCECPASHRRTRLNTQREHHGSQLQTFYGGVEMNTVT